MTGSCITLSSCDEVWHAGDIGDFRVTDAIGHCGALVAVHGNIDDHLMRRTFPEHQHIEREGCRIWMTHIGGRPGRYAKGIRSGLSATNPTFLCAVILTCCWCKVSKLGAAFT